MPLFYTVRVIDKLLRFDTANDDVVVTLLPFVQTPNAPYEIHKITTDAHTVTVRVDPTTTDFLLPGGATTIVLDAVNNTAMIHIPASGQSPAFVTTSGASSGGGDGGGGSNDILGPVTGITGAAEVGTRYTGTDRLVHLTVGFVPVCPTPQPVTYLVSADNGATWVWIGSQRMQSPGHQLLVDRLAPGDASQWLVACVAGNLGGDPTPIPDVSLSVIYSGVVRSAPFPVAGLAVPAPNNGITATIGSQSDVVRADGFTHYAVIPAMTYTDPFNSLDFFVRVTTQGIGANGVALAAEQPYGGTQITGPGDPHTIPALLFDYVPGLEVMCYRIYTANRNSQGDGDFSNKDTNTLQMVEYNGNPVLADHYNVPITIPPFTTPDPGGAFNVTSLTASEVGPHYQDTSNGALHTSVGVVPVIDADYSSPRTVTIWLDQGDGNPVWKDAHSINGPGQMIRFGDRTLGTDGAPLTGDIYVPTNPAYGNWIAYCAPGTVAQGTNPKAYTSAKFTVLPAGACIPNGTTLAQFLTDPATSDLIEYSKADPGIWDWGYYSLTWRPPSVVTDPNYWFTLITIQKGATINGTWTPAPDYEGANDDPRLNFLGRAHLQVAQLPGVANDQTSVIQKFGPRPANWGIPPLQNEDFSVNPYRDYRFLTYNVSRLGTDTSGSGGVGTYTLQTSCWPGGADHFILTPQPKNGSFDFRSANPSTISLPLTGGNGQPLAVQPYNPGDGTGGIGSNYLADDSVQARHMAEDAITAENGALAANAVADENVSDVNISKVTAGTQVFTGDVYLSRGTSKPVISLQSTGIFLYGVADGSNGHTGLTTQPYVGIQSTGIGLFQGGTGTVTAGGPATGGSVFLNASTSSITIYTKNGDLSQPFVTVSANGLALGDPVNGNHIDLNSAGMSIANASNKLVITATDLQLQLNNVARVTINTGTGVTISNGGLNSVVVGPTAITITASTGTLNASTTIQANQIQMAQGTATVTISASGIVLSNGGTAKMTLTATEAALVDASLHITNPGDNSYLQTGPAVFAGYGSIALNIVKANDGTTSAPGVPIGSIMSLVSRGIVLEYGTGGAPGTTMASFVADQNSLKTAQLALNNPSGTLVILVDGTTGTIRASGFQTGSNPGIASEDVVIGGVTLKFRGGIYIGH